jgi:carbon-monoxide dehydrogenase medium subunit
MKPAPFKYLRAETPQHAVQLLAEHGDDARLLAGGQTLIPMMNLRLARAGVLIDIGRLPLSEISAKPGAVSIGALTRHYQVLEHAGVAAASGIIPQAMREIAHPTIRNQGTAGGSIAYADPTAELCTLALLLDGEIEALSAKGGRRIPAKDYFVGAFETALKPDEMIAQIHLKPPATPHGGCFLEVSERKGDYAIAAAGATVMMKNGAVAEARIVMSGAASIPVRAHEAEKLLAGKAAEKKLIEQAAEAAVSDQGCYADIRASAEYRKELLQELVARAVTQACAEGRA